MFYLLYYCQLKTYKLQPRVAFHIWRPVINENLMKHWFPKTGTKVRVGRSVGFCFALSLSVENAFHDMEDQTLVIEDYFILHVGGLTKDDTRMSKGKPCWS